MLEGGWRGLAVDEWTWRLSRFSLASVLRRKARADPDPLGHASAARSNNPRAFRRVIADVSLDGGRPPAAGCRGDAAVGQPPARKATDYPPPPRPPAVSSEQ